MKRFLTLAAIVTSAAGFMSGCGKDNNNDTAASTTTTAATNDTVSAATLVLVATNYQFDKAELTAAAGQPVTFTITNNGTVDHNLTVKDLNVNKDVKPGKSASISVTPKAGTYEYHCEYHPTQMTGTLTVI